MKKLPLIFPLLIISLTAGAEEICNVDTTTTRAVDELASQNCEVTDQLKSCAEVPVDPDAVSRRFDNFMRISETPKDVEAVRRGHNTFYKNHPLMQYFHLDANEERWAKEDGKPYPRHILDWFTNDGKAEGLDREKFKETMKANYVKFAKDHDCNPIIKQNNNIYATVPGVVGKATEAEVKTLMNSPEYKAKKDAHFAQLNAKNIENGSYCEKDVMTGTGPYHLVAQTFPPCTGNISGVFRDNAWNASSLDEQLAGSAADGVVACIKERIARGAQIHHVSIVSSASALNNTGEAAKRFCKKGFLELSQARAQTAQQNILPQLFSKAGGNAESFADKVVLDFAGSNGDGTSGPCPYMLKDGREVIKPEFATPAGKRVLDEHKYIKIHVTFNSQTVPVENKKQFYEPHYKCRKIYFECAPR